MILPSLTNQLVEKNAMNTNTKAKTNKPRATLPAKLRFFILQKNKNRVLNKVNKKFLQIKYMLSRKISIQIRIYLFTK